MTKEFALVGGSIFTGSEQLDGHGLLVRGGRVKAVCPTAALPSGVPTIDVAEALIAPGFVDLQVNGGGGVLFNNDTSVDGIRQICASHARFGTTSVMVTLITDTRLVREAALTAGTEAFKRKVDGYLGLHLEGPHLSLSRKGTHDPALIRRMDDDDLTTLVNAAGQFGHALTTIAPENVSPQQVKTLTETGYTVSLGHTDVTADLVQTYVNAGASMVTHLFNAMSQMGNREPGLVGAALASGALSCGLIADGFHVDPSVMSIALRAKQGPGRIFLVTDAMSTIGTDDEGFDLNGRRVFRRGGRLTLADGTLAGADIDMLSCVRFVHGRLHVPLLEALSMASRYPAEAIGAAAKGRLAPGCDADFIVLDPSLNLHSTWIAGDCVHSAASIQEAASA